MAGDATLPLRDAVQRALRSQTGLTVLVLHLSRLVPPAPRPHHRRIARVVLGDVASRQAGQLFTLINGDLALLGRSADGAAALAATLINLFAADAPDAGVILSRWSLPDRLDDFAAFLDALPTMVAAPGRVEHDGSLAAVTTLFDALEPRRVRDLMVRHTGAVVTPGGAERVLPIFREIRFSLPALEARAATSGHVAADPFLFRHLVAKLDGPMLAAVVSDLDGGRPPVSGPSRMALHVNLGLASVLSPSFEDLVAAAGRARIKLAIEVAMLEAFADMEAFAAARRRIRSAECSLVLDDVGHHALLVSKPAVLGADYIKLDWSRHMLGCGGSLDAALASIDPHRVILQKADTEEAVRWGIARDVRRFQGRHTDAILAAGRLATCSAARACTLRKCIDRQAGMTPATRAGCANLTLLDASADHAEPVA